MENFQKPIKSVSLTNLFACLTFLPSLLGLGLNSYEDPLPVAILAFKFSVCRSQVKWDWYQPATDL